MVTGPCTNIAMLFRLFPHIKKKVQQIVLMGGGVKSGNVTSAAEFNMHEDPEAGRNCIPVRSSHRHGRFGCDLAVRTDPSAD